MIKFVHREKIIEPNSQLIFKEPKHVHSLESIHHASNNRTVVHFLSWWILINAVGQKRDPKTNDESHQATRLSLLSMKRVVTASKDQNCQPILPSRYKGSAATKPTALLVLSKNQRTSAFSVIEIALLKSDEIFPALRIPHRTGLFAVAVLEKKRRLTSGRRADLIKRVMVMMNNERSAKVKTKAKAFAFLLGTFPRQKSENVEADALINPSKRYVRILLRSVRKGSL